jgi:glycosyltransferase involved in cell wall biosynthesis
MKVAIIALSIKGALGQYAHCLCGALAKSSEVTLVAPAHFAYEPDGYAWQKMATARSRAQAAVRLVNPLQGLGMWRDIVRLQPDVVHILSGESYPWCAMGAPAFVRGGLPLVTTVHDVTPHGKDLFGAISVRLRKPVLRASTLLHVHSESARSQLGPLAARARVIPHGGFGPIFTRHKTGLAREPKTILFFGRIEHYKGVDILLEAAKALGSDWKIIIAGPGKIESPLAAMIAADPRVELRNGYLSDAEVAALYERASVCALPYRDATASSVPLISSAFGVPVVASNVGAFPVDVALVGGLLVPPENPRALAEAIAKAEAMPVKHPVELEFSFLKDKFLEVYREAQSKRTP